MSTPPVLEVLSDDGDEQWKDVLLKWVTYGDTSAMQAFATYWGPKLYTMAYPHLLDTHATWTAVHDTFLYLNQRFKKDGKPVYEKRPNVPIESFLKSVLYRRKQSEIRRFVSERKKDMRCEEYLNDPTLAQEDSPSAYTDAKKSAAVEALSSLDENDRKALVIKIRDQGTNEEVADAVGCSAENAPAFVRRALKRAKNSFQKVIKKYAL